MLRLLESDKAEYGEQIDKSKFPQQHALLEAKFASKTREEWATLFDGTDDCVTPVLTYDEAPTHPQNAARGGLRKQGSFVHPRPAPGFSETDPDPDFSVPGPNDAADEIFGELGYEAAKLNALKSAGITP